MLRSAPNYNLDNATGSLLSKMDATQHNRGWDLVAEKGIISVELVNQGPKDLKFHTKGKEKKTATKHLKEIFQFPTPADLTAKDLAPNKPKTKKEPKRRREAQREEAGASEGAGRYHTARGDQGLHGATPACGWALAAHLLHL